MSECEQRRIVASYGPEKSVDDTFPRWISCEQVSAFLSHLPGRLFPREFSRSLKDPISCFLVACGELLPDEEDPRYGSIVAIGTRVFYTIRELRAFAEGKFLPRMNEEEKQFFHPGWECKECHPENYPPPRGTLGGQVISYDTGQYGIPLLLRCRIHEYSIHYEVYEGEELEMMQKCARNCFRGCAGHCTTYWKQQEQAFFSCVYSLPKENN